MYQRSPLDFDAFPNSDLVVEFYVVLCYGPFAQTGSGLDSYGRYSRGAT